MATDHNSIIIVAIITFRRTLEKIIERFIKSDSGKAKFGPIEIELGKLAEQGQQAVENMNRITYLMAESRLLELEITEGKFGLLFSDGEREKMKSHIEEFKSLTTSIKK